MPVLTVANHKGGTGKTTTAIHIAAALGHQGRRVLVVDLDPQGFLTRMLGGTDPDPAHSSLGLINNPQADLRTFPVQRVSGFDLIASTMSLTKAARSLTRPTDVLWLKETIRAGHHYDLILIDTAAALSVFTMNALVASDHVLIPVTPEYQPVVGAEQTWQTAHLVQSKLNPKLATPNFVLTQVDARLNRHARYADYLRTKYGGAVMQTAIRTSSSLAVASRDGRTVFDTRHKTRGAVDYFEAARELSGHVFEADAETPMPADPPTVAEAAPSVAAPPEDATLHEVVSDVETPSPSELAAESAPGASTLEASAADTPAADAPAADAPATPAPVEVDAAARAALGDPPPAPETPAPSAGNFIFPHAPSDEPAPPADAPRESFSDVDLSRPGPAGGDGQG